MESGRQPSGIIGCPTLVLVVESGKRPCGIPWVQGGMWQAAMRHTLGTGWNVASGQVAYPYLLVKIKEPGCHCVPACLVVSLNLYETTLLFVKTLPSTNLFDVSKNTEKEHTYAIYEMYKNKDAVAFHKSTAHYKKWAAFKEAGK